MNEYDDGRLDTSEYLVGRIKVLYQRVCSANQCERLYFPVRSFQRQLLDLSSNIFIKILNRIREDYSNA